MASTSPVMWPWRKANSQEPTTAFLHSPAGEVPATGRPVTVDYIQVLRFRDGKPVSFNLMYNQLLLLEQLGLIPAQQPAG